MNLRKFPYTTRIALFLSAAALWLSAAWPLFGDPLEKATGSKFTPIDGTLVICGGGKLPETVFQEFLGLAGGADARIVVVTTASRRADTPEIERQLEFWRQQKVASLDVLHTRSREVAEQPSFSEPLTKATGVWFVGGDQSQITDAYLGTKTELRLHELLRRGGVIGGTSAGAAIMSRVMIVRGREEPVLGEGLGFLPGTIVDQHFLKRSRQSRLAAAVRVQRGLVGLGIDEGTALVVRGAQLKVIGESDVCAFLPCTEDVAPQVQTFRPGDQTDFTVLCNTTATTRTASQATSAVSQ